jgi:hypothetical protein
MIGAGGIAANVALGRGTNMGIAELSCFCLCYPLSNTSADGIVFETRQKVRPRLSSQALSCHKLFLI